MNDETAGRATRAELANRSSTLSRNVAARGTFDVVIVGTSTVACLVSRPSMQQNIALLHEVGKPAAVVFTVRIDSVWARFPCFDFVQPTHPCAFSVDAVFSSVRAASPQQHAPTEGGRISERSSIATMTNDMIRREVMSGQRYIHGHWAATVNRRCLNWQSIGLTASFGLLSYHSTHNRAEMIPWRVRTRMKYDPLAS